MTESEGLLIYYWQLPEDLFINLNRGFHEKFCNIVQGKVGYKRKNCFYKILNCPKWHAQRLFTQFNRMTLRELEILREFAEINKDEVERNIETLGNHEDGTIIKNPKLPFNLKDLIYISSHLMFDGSYRDKKGCYFYAYEPSLVEYHKKRLSVFGEVPINFMEKENQLYFSYTIGYIAKKILKIETFNSTKTRLSEDLKNLSRKNKILADEIVKALIIDEGSIDDKIEVELANETLVRDIIETIDKHYNFTKITSRTRTIEFKANPKWKHTTTVWNIGFAASSFQELYKSISPLPINYKNENLEFLYKRQTRKRKQRKHGETRRLIVLSLLNSSKTIEELAKELLIKQTTVRAQLRGHPNVKEPLISLGIVDKVDERILRRGGYAKAAVYGIKDINEANKFLNT